MLLIQKKDHYLRQGWRAFSQSVAKAPPVVTNLQQNCGMKKKKKKIQTVLISDWSKLLKENFSARVL